METVVFMEDSICREYVHTLFESGVDHVPVDESFRDLGAKAAEWAAGGGRGNDAAAMAARWAAKGRGLMSIECTLDYAEALLRRYAALQRFVPQRRKDWVRYSLENVYGAPFPWNDGSVMRPTSECTPPRFSSRPRVHTC